MHGRLVLASLALIGCAAEDPLVSTRQPDAAYAVVEVAVTDTGTASADTTAGEAGSDSATTDTAVSTDTGAEAD